MIKYGQYTSKDKDKNKKMKNNNRGGACNGRRSNIVVSFFPTTILFILLLLSFERSFLSNPPSIVMADLSVTVLCNEETEYFDTSSLSCVLCDDGDASNQYKVPDMTYQDVYGNALRCKCGTGYRENEESCNSNLLLAGTCLDFTCSDSCFSTSDASSLDNLVCLSCGASTSGYDSTIMDCTCNPGSDGYTYSLLAETDTAGVQASEKSCVSCPTGEFVVTGTDPLTTAGETYNVDLYKCASCPDENMEFASGSCSCTTDYTLTGISSIGKQSCILTADYAKFKSTYPENQAIGMTYTDAREEFSIASLGIQHYYTYAATNCYSYHGPQNLAACQTLANLCVLQLYDLTHTICKLFREIEHRRSSYVNNREGWSNTLPWLYYEQTASAISEDTGIGMTLGFPTATGSTGVSSFVSMDTNSVTELDYKLIKWSINGTYLGITSLTTELMYCSMPSPYSGEGGGTSRSTKWLQYGYNDKIEYTCDLSTLFTSETYFYDLFLVDERDGTLYPVPVLIKSYVNDDGIEVNRNKKAIDEIDDEYVRRFFLYDTISGVTTNSETISDVYDDDEIVNEINGEADGSSLLPVILRYAKKISLRVVSQVSDPSKIYPPTLTIEYESRLQTEVFSASDSELTYDDLSFKVEYTMDTTAFWTTAKIFFGMACSAIFLVWAVRMRNWTIRTTRIKSERDYYRNVSDQSLFDQVPWMIETAVLLFHSIVIVLFPFVFAICGFWFAFFKLQETTFILMPENNEDYGSKSEYYPLIILINMMFFFQLIKILHTIYIQTQADVFFIDWEKDTNDAGLVAAAAGDTAAGGFHNAGKNKSSGPSVWRSINVANKFIDLSVYRKISIEFSLLWMTFFLLGLNLEYNATAQPNLIDTSTGAMNPALRFANTTFWWLLCAAVQLLWRRGFYERFVSESFEQYFVDLCTLSKISLIIMDEAYHGWYVHCRSPYPYADGTMMDLVDQLRKEQAGLTSDRGLEGAPKDVQSFEIYVSELWRQKYNKIYESLYEYSSFSINSSRARLGAAKRRGQTSGGRRDRHTVYQSGVGGTWSESGADFFTSLFWATKNSNLPSEKLIEASNKLTTFLQAFAENYSSKRDLRRVVREPTVMDKLLQIPPDIKNGGTGCIFSPDRSYGFTRNMFLGNEYDLLLLNILAFSSFNLWTDSTAAAILMTYLLEIALKTTRRHFGKLNLSNKSFLDGNFLK